MHALPNFFEPDKVYEEVGNLFDQGFKGVESLRRTFVRQGIFGATVDFLRFGKGWKMKS